MEEHLSLRGIVREGGVDESYGQHVKGAVEAWASLRSGECLGSDYIGWVDLPESVEGVLEDVVRVGESLRSGCEAIVVVGIGGSYLGAKALLHALDDQRGADGLPIHFMGHTLCGDWLSAELSRLDGVRYGVVVISKSGTTLEPAASLRAVLAHMRGSAFGYSADRVVAITDARRGTLYEMAVREGFARLVIPDDVGGRYSVLTPVGLLPLLLGGVDVRGMLSGAKAAHAQIWHGAPGGGREVVLQYAAMRHALYLGGRSVEVLATYTPYMQYFGEWYKQLFGESEGKGGGGVFPTSVTYSTDLHSLGQYVQDGQPLLFETHVAFRSSHSGLCVPVGDDFGDGLGYVSGAPFAKLNEAVYEGAFSAHSEGGVPCIRMDVPARSAYWLGYLVYVFEVACALSVLMQAQNPFDQPGVEAYKRNMFRLLKGE